MSLRDRLRTFRRRVAKGRKNQLFVEPDSADYEAFGPRFLNVTGGKIVIFGIPKCGNAWLQSMLVQYFDTNPVMTLQQADTQGVLSIHDPFREEMMYRRDFANGVCLIRDIRDVIVSYFHYGRTDEFRREMKRFYYDDFDSFYFEWFLSRCVPSHSLHTFADDYAARGIPVVRYERLQSNCESELARLVARWGANPDREKIGAIVRKHELKILKATGLDLGYQVEASHFRKGGWGNFLTEMPQHILADANARFEAYLRRWGYPLSLTDESIRDYRARLSIV